MQFTPQQARGGQRYNTKIRIGNWKEDIVGEEMESKEFIMKQNKKGNYQSLQSRIVKCTQTVPHTYSEDGKLRYGDTIIIKHLASGVTVASDPSIDANPPHQQLLVVGANENRPTARNTFRIMRPPSNLLDVNIEDDYYDDTLKYGQPFLLACNESLLVSDDGFCLNPTLYLSSLQRNYRTATRITNKQAVFLTTHCDAEALWTTALPSQGKAVNWRTKFPGDSIVAGDNFLLKHRNTNTCLTINSSERCQTDYGYELEVMTSPETSVGKLSLVEYEYAGKGTSQTLRKPDLVSHELTFLTSSHPRQAVDHRNLPTPSHDPKDLLLDLSASLRSLGLLVFVELRLECLEIDRQGKFSSYSKLGARGPRGKIDLADFKSLLQKKGIISDSYYDELLKIFLDPPSSTSLSVTHPPQPSRPRSSSSSSSFSITSPPTSSSSSCPEFNYRLFIERLRGKLSPSRQRYLTSIYDQLLEQQEGGEEEEGLLALDTLFNRFHCPEILREAGSGGRAIASDLFRVQFLERVVDFIQIGPRCYITKESFLNYWNDYSPLIGNDREFEQLIHDCCDV